MPARQNAHRICLWIPLLCCTLGSGVMLRAQGRGGVPAGDVPIDPVAARKDLAALQLELRRVQREHQSLLDLYQDLAAGLLLEPRAEEHYFRAPYEVNARRMALDQETLADLKRGIRHAEETLAVRQRDWENLGGRPLWEPRSSGTAPIAGGSVGGAEPRGASDPSAGALPWEEGGRTPRPTGSDGTVGAIGGGGGGDPATGGPAPGSGAGQRDADGWVRVPQADSWARPDLESQAGMDPVPGDGPRDGASDGLGTGIDPGADALDSSAGARAAAELDARLRLQRDLQARRIQMEREPVEQWLPPAPDQGLVARMQFKAATQLIRAAEELAAPLDHPVVQDLRRRARFKLERAIEVANLEIDRLANHTDGAAASLPLMFCRARAVEQLFLLDAAEGALDLTRDSSAWVTAFSEVVNSYEDVVAQDTHPVENSTPRQGPWAKAAASARNHFRREEASPLGTLRQRIHSIRWDKPADSNGGTGVHGKAGGR